jgi:hypothetical protein
MHAGISVTKDGGGHLTRTPEGYVNIDLRVLSSDFRRTYERLMDEMETETRPAPGLARIADELTQRTDPVARFAEELPPYPTPLQLLDATQSQSLPGTIPFMPIHAASATNFPLTDSCSD